MAAKKGSLSISSENIFPIIKKWVYSDHDIFARELVSNGCDAITKLKKLDMMGEYELPEDYKPKIEVIVNPEEKTMKFIDNGLGMTAEEVEEYITQIAFSGATQFLEKYKDKTTDTSNLSKAEIISKNFTQLVMQNYTMQRSVAWYAKRLGITQAHLSSIIKQTTGKTCIEIITSMVIMDAKAQLKSTNLSIHDIAYTLNFTNMSFFGKYFKRYVGMSPQEYRNS